MDHRRKRGMKNFWKFQKKRHERENKLIGDHKEYSGKRQVKIDEKQLYKLLVEADPKLAGGKIICIENHGWDKGLKVVVDFEDAQSKFYRI